MICMNGSSHFHEGMDIILFMIRTSIYKMSNLLMVRRMDIIWGK
jgi:hypothetical protein